MSFYECPKCGGIPGVTACCTAKPAQPAASVEPFQPEAIRVGNLPTMNQDEYPGLGGWWVQLRIGPDGDEVLARVYGSTPEQARSRAVTLAAPVAAQPSTPMTGQCAGCACEASDGWALYCVDCWTKTTPVASQPSVLDGWKEAAIAWEVCASLHREWAKGKDALFITRQRDFVKHANDARAMLTVLDEE